MNEDSDISIVNFSYTGLYVLLHAKERDLFMSTSNTELYSLVFYVGYEVS
jgi:hypothetical protein